MTVAAYDQCLCADILCNFKCQAGPVPAFQKFIFMESKDSKDIDILDILYVC